MTNLDLQIAAALRGDQPYAVTAPLGMTKLYVMNAQDAVPGSFTLQASRARRKVVVRIAGGCSNMDHTDKLDMLRYFAEAFQGFGGAIISGATREVIEGTVDPIVTEIPGVIAALNPGVVPLGTAPRTSRFRLLGQSVLHVAEGETTIICPSQDAALYVQTNPNASEGKWDGDLDAYIEVMQQLREDAGFAVAGLVAWNGGGVTKTELNRIAEKGWPVIVINGSGRAADEYAANTEFTQRPNVFVAERGDVRTLRDRLFATGLLEL